jgi:hypothetical protein
MQARNQTMTVGNDEAQRGQAEPTTRERTPRFKLIKLEERIAPGGLQGVSLSCRAICPINIDPPPSSPSACGCL